MSGSDSLVQLLGVPADRRVLSEGPVELLEQAQPDTLPVPVVLAAGGHGRLVATGSALTAATLIGGGALLVLGLIELVFGGGGLLAVVLAVLGGLMVATHWGWVHVAEYVGITIDERHASTEREREDRWLATIRPYPRFAVVASVLDDASTRIERVLLSPQLTDAGTFTFTRRTEAAETFDASTDAHVIASEAEAMRRQARLDTDRQREQWEAAETAYNAALTNADDDRQRLAAQRAAATALSEHINARLREPPLVE